MLKFDETNLIANLRKLPLDLLVVLAAWIDLIQIILQRLIVRETLSSNIAIESINKLAVYRALGIEAYNRSIQQKITLEQAAFDLSSSKAPALTILSHAKQFKKQVLLVRNERIAALKAAGFTTRKIASEYGLNSSTISRICKIYNKT